MHRNNRFTIVDEKAVTTKGSSLMFQAGAESVFFIAVKQGHLNYALSFVRKELDDHAIICESGGLSDYQTIEEFERNNHLLKNAA